MADEKNRGKDLLTLRRMATQLGEPCFGSAKQKGGTGLNHQSPQRTLLKNYTSIRALLQISSGRWHEILDQITWLDLLACEVTS